MAIKLRTVKGSALTYQEADVNFSSLIYTASQVGNHIAFHTTGSSTIGQLPSSGSINVGLGLNTFAIAQYSHAEGQITSASGDFSHAEGSFTKATGIGSHAEGEATTASGSYSHAEGVLTQAVGNYSHAEGSNTVSLGTYSHAEGLSTDAVGDYSHAEGRITSASGNYSHAEGYFTDAAGQYAHAEGYQTVATGQSSHTEGGLTQAVGAYSHAEGNATSAEGSYSHAEGLTTKAVGNGSHAEGWKTLASASYSHAEGYFVTASGVASHAEGLYTVASGQYQHVQGTYNLSSSNQGAFIIGNGTGQNGLRSNLIYASGSQVQISGSLSPTSATIGTGYFNTLPTPFYSENFSTGIGAFVDGGGDAAWTRVTNEGNGDLFSIRSGVTGNLGTSIVQVTQTTTQESTLLSYDYKTSTEGDYDFLFVEVNGILIRRYSGTNAWTTDRIFIHGIGSKVIRFIYYKDLGTTGGTDQVWIDNVKLINYTEGLTISTPSLFKDTLVVSGSLVGKGLSSFDDVYINSKLSLVNDRGNHSLRFSSFGSPSGQYTDGAYATMDYGAGKQGVILSLDTSASAFTLSNPFTLNAAGDGIYMTVGSSSFAGIEGTHSSLQIPNANTKVRFGQYATANPTSLFAVTGETTFTGTVVVAGSTTYTQPTAADTSGEIVYLGTGTGLTAGNLYYLNTSLVWTACDASAVASSTGMLAIALGTTVAAGMLVRGFARFATTPYTGMADGQIQYASITAGAFSGTAPTTAGEVVRIIGYCVSAANDTFYFTPDNTWIELQ